MARPYHDPSGARAPLCEAEGLAVVPFFLSIVDTERESAWSVPRHDPAPHVFRLGLDTVAR